MLYVTYDDKFDREWHVGGGPLEVGHNGPAVWQRPVTQVQADGHELEYILANFSGIPTVRNRRVVTWHGDFARFIASNLR